VTATVVERDLVDAIESTLFIYPAVPGLMHDLGIPGLRGRVTRLSHPVANLAGNAMFSEREADALIAKVRQRYGQLEFSWVTGPSTRPADLPKHLEAAGLAHAQSLAGMALADISTVMGVNPKARVWEATFEEAREQNEMMARAYGLPAEVMHFFNELLAASTDHVRSRLYFAGLDDEPLAWSYLTYLPESPIVLLGGAGTLEQHRGHGLYTALVAKRLADARIDGRTTAVVQADRATSAPICAKLGFREICGLEIFASTRH
jgi:hypothetical protein